MHLHIPIHTHTHTGIGVSGKKNILRAAQYDSEYIVAVKLQCRGQCFRFVLTSVPTDGELCWDSPASTGNWTCDPESVVENGTVIPLYDGHDDPDRELMNYLCDDALRY